MTKNILTSAVDDIPVSGGIELPLNLIATPTSNDKDLPDDDLGRQVYWLLKLHPDAIPRGFCSSDLAKMDAETKRKLIKVIQDSLGIVPLTGDVL